jgi:D-threo-aldose 1-dehydrogenase
VMDAPVTAMPGFRIHHRALPENFRGLHQGLVTDTVRCAKWSDDVGANLVDGETLASLMLKAALVENPASVILFSSKNPAHIRHNVGVVDDGALEAPAKKLYELVQAAAKDLRTIEAGG